MIKEDIKEEIKKFSAIDAVSKSAGGKILVKSLQQDIVSCIDKFANKYSELTLEQFIANSASLSTKLALLRTLNRANNLKKIASEDLKFLTEEE